MEIKNLLGPSAFGARVAAAVNFHGKEQNGIKPIGLKSLLDACSLNQARIWHQSKEFFNRGVLGVPSGTTMNNLEARLEKMDRLYPFFEGAKGLGCVAHEGQHNNMRGSHMVGDDDDLANFWAFLSDKPATHGSFLESTGGLNRALLWTAMIPNTVYVPYLDIDEKSVSENDLTNLLEKRILPAITLVQKAIQKRVETEIGYQMFFGQRPIKDGLFKFSFHIHFYTVGIANIASFKQMLTEMTELPRKLNWRQNALGAWIFEEDQKPLFDLGVYSGRRQLFRGPFCGKSEDLKAVLLPVHPVRDENKWRLLVEEDHNKAHYILRARIARSAVGLRMMNTIQHVSLGDLPIHVEEKQMSSTSRQDNTTLYNFFRPLIYGSILPTWQKFRFDDLSKQTVGSGGTVPFVQLRVSKDEPGFNKVGVRYLAVEGDTYCMMDSNHFHSSSPRCVGVILDLIHCTIQQSCFACAKPSEKFCFLHLGNTVRIETHARSRFSCLLHYEPCKSESHQFLLDYFAPLFRYHRITEQVWVYDEETRVWRNGARGNRVVGMLIDRLNGLYNAYLNTKKQITVDNEIKAFGRSNRDASQEDSEAFVVKVYEDARVFIEKHTNIIRVASAARGKILEELKQYTVREELSEFNPFHFLLPMKNGQALNVFTLETEEIRPTHYFTGVLNAELIAYTHPEVKEIEGWFWEVSTGNPDKARYLKIIAGYMMTMSVHDRKFYVLKGTGRNGKGLFKQFLLNILDGPDGSEPRWKALKPGYWAQRATAGESSESASPEAALMLHKSLVYTDDMDQCLIDAGKVKREVAGEPKTARQLYGNPIQFRPTAKILWTSNFVPNGPGNDQAYWDRHVLLQMLTKYTDDPSKVDEAHFVFAMNEVRYKALLGKRDAFFSVCVRELYDYYSRIPFDNETKEPSKLLSFTLPPCIERDNRDARETMSPLAAFINEHTCKPSHPLERVSTDTLFTNYIQFLENQNYKKLKAETTQMDFVRLLSSGLEINTFHNHVDLKLVKTCMANLR